MDMFGDTDPKKMPPGYFYDVVGIDYPTAVRADVSKQDYTVAPRHWDVDAKCRCRSCRAEYVWSASEQKQWFEEFRFNVSSKPKECPTCRVRRRRAIRLGQEYAAKVAQARSHGTAELKNRIVEIIDELEAYWGRVPNKVRETREIFRRQLSRSASS
jgi:hypothetical protein